LRWTSAAYGESDAPAGRPHYAFDALLGDVTGLLDVLGIAGPVRVVGHDLGAAVAWGLAIRHRSGWARRWRSRWGIPEYALAGWEQKRKGLYTLGWQFPGMAERWLAAGDWRRMRHWLRHHPDVEDCIRDLSAPASHRGAQLVPREPAHRADALVPESRVPMLGLWSSGDHCLAEDQMARSVRRVQAPWRYERIEDARHWVRSSSPGVSPRWRSSGSRAAGPELRVIRGAGCAMPCGLSR